MIRESEISSFGSAFLLGVESEWYIFFSFDNPISVTRFGDADDSAAEVSSLHLHFSAKLKSHGVFFLST
jgi:hypothetical protein